MIRTVISISLVTFLAANSAVGDTIGAAYLEAHGRGVTIWSNATGSTGARLGPYDYKLSVNGTPRTPGNLVDQLLDQQDADAATTPHRLPDGSPDPRTITFCFDLYQSVDTSHTVRTYTIARGEELLYLPSGTRTYEIDGIKLEMLAHLWSTGYKAAYVHAATNAGHALSLAIWETIYEYANLDGWSGAGDPIFDVDTVHDNYGTRHGFEVTSWNSLPNKSSVIALANGWLSDAYFAATQGVVDTSSMIALYNSCWQDQSLMLFAQPKPPEEVPEPTLAIQLLGLCVAGTLPLRYWRRGRKGTA